MCNCVDSVDFALLWRGTDGRLEYAFRAGDLVSPVDPGQRASST